MARSTTAGSCVPRQSAGSLHEEVWQITYISQTMQESKACGCQPGHHGVSSGVSTLFGEDVGMSASVAEEVLERVHGGMASSRGVSETVGVLKLVRSG